VTVPKHERLIERLTDAFWLRDVSVTAPERMIDVVERLVEILQSQPRGVDDDGSLYWAGQWLKERLEREEQDG
jgi:hypothetical protein